MLTEYFKNGINMGGFLSQYELITDAASSEKMEMHLKKFITEKNIEQIASWHFDHVRIPLEGRLLFDQDTKKLKDSILQYLDRTIDWCAKYKLHVILDLHGIWGHTFGQMDIPTELMVNPALRENFIAFWTEMTKHFEGYQATTLLFELFNEICDATGYCWNSLYTSTVKEIRKIDTTRMILIGTNYVNSVGYLDRLALLDDANTFYNFHYYEPNVFTHQKAIFSEEFLAYGKNVNYPDDISDYIVFLDENPRYAAEHPLMDKNTITNDHKLMLKLMKPAIDFVRYSGHEAFCSEFGVIDTAPEEEAVKWLQDYMQLCDTYHIGHTMWNYKCLDFELVDLDNQVVRPEIVRSLCEFNKKTDMSYNYK